jgi:hypothetical protein
MFPYRHKAEMKDLQGISILAFRSVAGLDSACFQIFGVKTYLLSARECRRVESIGA